MPLPTDLVLSKPQSKEYPPIPADMYQCEITDIEYKEIDNRYKKSPSDPDKRQIMNFEFTIIEEGSCYGRKVWVKAAPTVPTPGSNGKVSWIWRIASALAGHPITKEEGEKYTTNDINGFIHRQIRVNIVQALGTDGKTYNNADGFLPAKVLLHPFDESKIADDVDEPDQQTTPQQPQTGYEKAQAVAATLPGTNQPATGQIEANTEPSADDDVSGIPF